MNKVQLGNISALQRRKKKKKRKKEKNKLTGNRTQVNRMKDYYVHHYAIHAVTIGVYIYAKFKLLLGIQVFFADENIFRQKKIKRYLQKKNGIVFSCVILKPAVFFEQFLQSFVSLGESHICLLEESASILIPASKKGSSWVQR